MVDTIEIKLKKYVGARLSRHLKASSQEVWSCWENLSRQVSGLHCRSNINQAACAERGKIPIGERPGTSVPTTSIKANVLVGDFIKMTESESILHKTNTYWAVTCKMKSLIRHSPTVTELSVSPGRQTHLSVDNYITGGSRLTDVKGFRGVWRRGSTRSLGNAAETSRDRGHWSQVLKDVCACGYFMMIHGRSQHNVVKQLSSNKIFFKCKK